MLGVPVMVRRVKNTGGRPRTLKGRIPRQISLDTETDAIASEMHNFSAFVRRCLLYRDEHLPFDSQALVVSVQERLVAQHHDGNEWTNAKAEEADELLFKAWTLLMTL